MIDSDARSRASDSADVVIVGGGMVGAALACALGQQDLRVTVIEAHAPERDWPANSVDLRVSALTRASQRMLARLGAWQRMTEMGVSPYREMHVWDARGTGSIHFDSADIGEPNLGHIVENRVTRLALWERLEDLSSVRLVCPAGVDALEPAGDRTLVRLDSGDTVRTALVVAADGTRSHIRTMAGIGTRGWAYGQQAVVASVVTERPHGATARQRFLAEGPLAFLPLNDGECSIVWSTSPQHAEALLAMEEDRFCSELGEAFGYTLGRITSTGPRASFPLRLQHARHYVQRRLALVGDAAHAIHPLAGQGVNLGLMDAAALAEVLEDASARGRDPGGLDVLRRYERARKGANLGMLAVMDGFKRLFGSQQPVLRLARNFGLDVVDGAAPLKQLIIRHAMGLAGEQPRLARVNAGR